MIFTALIVIILLSLVLCNSYNKNIINHNNIIKKQVYISSLSLISLLITNTNNNNANADSINMSKALSSFDATNILSNSTNTNTNNDDNNNYNNNYNNNDDDYVHNNEGNYL